MSDNTIQFPLSEEYLITLLERDQTLITKITNINNTFAALEAEIRKLGNMDLFLLLSKAKDAVIDTVKFLSEEYH